MARVFEAAPYWFMDGAARAVDIVLAAEAVQRIIERRAEHRSAGCRDRMNNCAGPPWPFSRLARAALPGLGFQQAMSFINVCPERGCSRLQFKSEGVWRLKANACCKRRSKNPSLKRPVGPVAPE